MILACPFLASFLCVAGSDWPTSLELTRLCSVSGLSGPRWTPVPQLLPTRVGGHLAGSHVLAVTNSAEACFQVVNLLVMLTVWIWYHGVLFYFLLLLTFWFLPAFVCSLIALSCSIHGTAPLLLHLILTSLIWFQGPEALRGCLLEVDERVKSLM